VARHRHVLQTRTTDLDWLGHVNNVVYLGYLQEARMDVIMQWRGGLRHPTQDTVVARVECDYTAVLEHRPEPFVVETWTERLGRTSYTFAHEIRDVDGPVVYARGRSVLVQVDKATLKPVELDDSLRAFLAGFTDDGDPSVPG
jgi:acyl-CoA thioester hydrolase